MPESPWSILEALGGPKKAEVERRIRARDTRLEALRSFVQKELKKKNVLEPTFLEQISPRNTQKVQKYFDAREAARQQFFAVEAKKLVEVQRRKALAQIDATLKKRTEGNPPQQVRER